MREKLRMSVKEAERLSVMKQVDKKLLTIERASEELGISMRQAKRIRKRYLEKGEPGLVSKKRGVPSNRKLPEETRDRVMTLLTTRYTGFGPTLASETLEKRDKIKISGETLRKWMTEQGVWKPKRKKEPRVYQRRARRSRFGELLQGDGSPHDWFEGRGEKCTLLQFVDDATSKTTVAQFAPTEGTEEYSQLLEQHLKKYGRPLGLYVDKHTTFRVNREETQKGVRITHFGRIVKELGIELICAHSPQAKGRVENKNGVLQDRLVKEMRLQGISTIEEANAFLPGFLEDLNRRFGKEPANSEDAHRPLRPQDDLKRIFARKDTRKLSKDLTFQHRGVLYLIETKSPNRLKHATVNVLWREQEPIEVFYNETKLEYKKWAEVVDERPDIRDSKEIACSNLMVEKKGMNNFLNKKNRLTAIERRRKGMGGLC